MNELLIIFVMLVLVYIIYVDVKNNERDRFNSQQNIDTIALLNEMVNYNREYSESQNKINEQTTKILKMMQGTKVPDVDKINETLKESDEKGVEK